MLSRGWALTGEMRTRVFGHGSGLGLAWGVVRDTANSPGYTRGRVGLWRGTQQHRAALRDCGLTGVRLRAGQRGNKG